MTDIKRIKYFHPQGKSIPNGSHYQRGGFMNECKLNKDSFALNVGAPSEQKGECNGGVMIFPAGVDITSLLSAQNDSARTTFYVGNAFKGRYIDCGGEEYDATSATMEVSGLSTKQLLRLAKACTRFFGHTAIVKDLNGNQLYRIASETGEA